MRFMGILLVLGLVVGGVVRAQDDGQLSIHVVQRGENLFRIALQHNMTAEELATLNGISNPANIQVGQRLLVPSGDGPLNRAGVPLVPEIHVVQPGETLNSIAQLYGMEVEQLATFNNVTDPNTLFIGQVLQLQESVEVATAETAVEASSAGNGAEVVIETDPALTAGEAALVPLTEPTTLDAAIHTVQSGETLFRIATQYNLTVNQVASANNITDPTVVYAGQQLLIPGVEPPPVAVELPAPLSAVRVNPLVFTEGKTGIIEVTATDPVEITGRFLEQDLRVITNSERTLYRVYVGIPVFTDTGVYPLNLHITQADGTVVPFNTNIQVLGGGYGSERISLLGGRDDLLNENIEQAELVLLQGATATFTPERYFDGPMSLPAAASMTSPFGTLRSYNGGAFDRYHSGTDFAGVPGTPILAPAAGRVVLADQLNVRGNATVIDHGWGIYTGYWHQNEVYVQPGDFVETGQVLGTIGSTGRVTGAHLHWELWVNGVPVDPMQWVQQSFS